MPMALSQSKKAADEPDDALIPQNANDNKPLVMHVTLPNLFAPGGGGGGGQVRPLARAPDASASRIAPAHARRKRF